MFFEATSCLVCFAVEITVCFYGGFVLNLFYLDFQLFSFNVFFVLNSFVPVDSFFSSLSSLLKDCH